VFGTVTEVPLRAWISTKSPPFRSSASGSAVLLRRRNTEMADIEKVLAGLADMIRC
jgi:hypothetical protein